MRGLDRPTRIAERLARWHCAAFARAILTQYADCVTVETAKLVGAGQAVRCERSGLGIMDDDAVAGRSRSAGAACGCSADLTYFEYQRSDLRRGRASRGCRSAIPLDGLVVGDFGAHHGGMVDALRESRQRRGQRSASELRDERRRVRLHSSADDAIPPRGRRRAWRSADRDVPRSTRPLHDVLEHVPGRTSRALARLLSPARRRRRSSSRSRPTTRLSAVNQHLARGLARCTPFLQFLPGDVYLHGGTTGRQRIHDGYGHAGGHGVDTASVAD